MPESTDEKQPPHLFKPGQSGNPSGRPKGSRNKLGEQFISDLYADWQEHGAAVVAKVRDEKPDQYLKVVASILPKEVRIERLDDMNDDELAKQIRRLAADLNIALDFVEGDGGIVAGAEAPATAH